MPDNYQIEQIAPELTWNIRQQELYPNLDIAAVRLEEDFNGIHFGIFANKKLIGVVSTFEEDDNIQFRKLAISKEYQGQKYGSILLNYLIDYAKELNKKTIWCNARMSALNFYKNFGFVSSGKTFSKNGIDFMIVKKDL